jgi:hypothetical protein
MSLWELSACVRGFNRANSPDDPKVQPPSSEDHRDRMRRLH